MKRVIPVNTAESAYPPTVDPSASVGPAIMRVPIVRKVGCFTSCSFCCRNGWTDRFVPRGFRSLIFALSQKLQSDNIRTNEKFVAISGMLNLTFLTDHIIPFV